MAYNRTEYPQWSWSSSRKSTFDECRRRYYYNYYLAHNGWEDDADEDSRLAYRLKNLTGIHLLLGSAVHEVAAYASKIAATGRLPEVDELTEKVRFILNQAWRESKNPEAWHDSPKRNFMLFEFYYGNGLESGLIEKIKDKMNLAVPNILSSDSISDLMSGECELRITEDMDTFEMFDTQIYAVPDLVYERSDGQWIVTDWKTGKEHDTHPAQINVYCMYIESKYKIPPEKLTGKVEYLLTGKSKDVKVDRDTFRQTAEDMKKSIEDMKSWLEDPSLNKPLPRHEYPLASHRNLCRWCNFFQLCEDELGRS